MHFFFKQIPALAQQSFFRFGPTFSSVLLSNARLTFPPRSQSVAAESSVEAWSDSWYITTSLTSPD